MLFVLAQISEVRGELIQEWDMICYNDYLNSMYGRMTVKTANKKEYIRLRKAAVKLYDIYSKLNDKRKQYMLVKPVVRQATLLF